MQKSKNELSLLKIIKNFKRKVKINKIKMQDTETNIKAITNENLAKRTQKVKNIANSWASDISAIISESEEWKEYSNEPCTKFALYHISKGIIKNQLLRRMFMDASDIYISRHVQKRNEKQKA